MTGDVRPVGLDTSRGDLLVEFVVPLLDGAVMPSLGDLGPDVTRALRGFLAPADDDLRDTIAMEIAAADGHGHVCWGDEDCCEYHDLDEPERERYRRIADAVLAVLPSTVSEPT